MPTHTPTHVTDPEHPGVILARDFLAPAGTSVYRLAKSMGIPRHRLDRIIAGTVGVTPDTAVRLGLVFGNDPAFWLDLQSRHDVAIVQREAGAAMAEQVTPLDGVVK